MNQTIHSYHPTIDPSRGLHAFTTPDPFEALAIIHAGQVKRASDDVLTWSAAIIEAVEAIHGAGQTTQHIKAAIDALDAASKAAGGPQP